MNTKQIINQEVKEEFECNFNFDVKVEDTEMIFTCTAEDPEYDITEILDYFLWESSEHLTTIGIDVLLEEGLISENEITFKNEDFNPESEALSFDKFQITLPIINNVAVKRNRILEELGI